MSKKKFTDYTKYRTSICRTSWVYIFERDKDKKGNDAPRRKCTFMIPKSVDVIDIKISDEGKKKIVESGKKFKKEFEAAALAFAEKYFEMNKKELEENEIRWNPVLDGDKAKLKKAYKGNEGHWIIRAGTNNEYEGATQNPFVFNRDNEIVLEVGTLSSGDWVKGDLNFYGYNTDGNVGVGAGMEDIRHCYKGTFKSNKPLNTEFDDDEELETLEATSEDFDKDDDDDTDF